MSTTLHILLAANDKYAMPMSVAAHSAASRVPHDYTVEINIIDDEISETNAERALRVLRNAHPHGIVSWRKLDLAQFSNVNARQYSKASLIRLLAPNLFGEGVDRVLYLDSDLVVEADISVLWDIDLGDKAVWAVQNGDNSDFSALIDRLQLGGTAAADGRYFNSGVLLINLGEWRRQQITERTIDFLLTHNEKLSFPDQDALNAIINGNWGRLPPRWNKQIIRLGQPESAPMSEPGILHYSSYKPWDPKYAWPGSAVFHSAYIRSGWEPGIAGRSTALRLSVAQFIAKNAGRIARGLNLNQN